MADVLRPKGARAAARLVGERLHGAANQVARRDALFSVFVDELRHVMQANGKKLLGEQQALDAYEQLRSGLGPDERDEFLRALLSGVQSLADDARRQLRAIIERHVERLTFARNEEP